MPITLSPAQSSITGKKLVDQGWWLEAGRCLLHMKDILDAALITKIATTLSNQINPRVEYKAVPEVPSSLARRHEPEFDLARKIFTEAVAHLAEGYGKKGASFEFVKAQGGITLL